MNGVDLHILKKNIGFIREKRKRKQVQNRVSNIFFILSLFFFFILSLKSCRRIHGPGIFLKICIEMLMIVVHEE